MIISTAELEKYFGKEVTPAKMKEQIMSLLDDWKEKQPPELAKAPKSRNLTSNNFETLCPDGPALAQRLWWYISPVAACFLVQPGVGRQGCSAPPFSAARP